MASPEFTHPIYMGQQARTRRAGPADAPPVQLQGQYDQIIDAYSSAGVLCELGAKWRILGCMLGLHSSRSAKTCCSFSSVLEIATEGV